MELYRDLCVCDLCELDCETVSVCMWNAEAIFFTNTQILPGLFEE